ncbi:hypothetical protein CAEBREN_17457 [Caenorhabditis brenneri]|uniref:Uncharacterized protein n=1 Tax=Caenorhabditis brenneri TaxID=135651 RepID=G0P440_CAEBE|nr:hypothetical protein CAEBREN_17457 [Caenorhabditis brenneri]
MRTIFLLLLMVTLVQPIITTRGRCIGKIAVEMGLESVKQGLKLFNCARKFIADHYPDYTRLFLEMIKSVIVVSLNAAKNAVESGKSIIMSRSDENVSLPDGMPTNGIVQQLTAAVKTTLDSLKSDISGSAAQFLKQLSELGEPQCLEDGWLKDYLVKLSTCEAL